MFMDSYIYEESYDVLERQHSAIDLMWTLNHLVEYTCRELLNSEGEFEVAQFEKAMRRAVRARHFHERELVFAAFSFWYPEFVSGCWLLRWVLAGFAHQWVGGSMQSVLINNKQIYMQCVHTQLFRNDMEWPFTPSMLNPTKCFFCNIFTLKNFWYFFLAT